MEPIIVLVGFLGAGKTSLLKRLVNQYLEKSYSPTIILNDYENANLDAQYFKEILGKESVTPIRGSCVCCSGIVELREEVNAIGERNNGVTLIEANGTTDACTLMEFLGVGISEHFLPPIQISVVDARHWQKRGEYNDLEANQIKVSSIVILNRTEDMIDSEIEAVKVSVHAVNPVATLVKWKDFHVNQIEVMPKISGVQVLKIAHQKSHWSSCSVALPAVMVREKVYDLLRALPQSIMRAKGCTRFDHDDFYTFFEMTPDREIVMRRYDGELISGPALLVVGPGSEPDKIMGLVKSHS